MRVGKDLVLQRGREKRGKTERMKKKEGKKEKEGWKGRKRPDHHHNQ